MATIQKEDALKINSLNVPDLAVNCGGGSPLLLGEHTGQEKGEIV